MKLEVEFLILNVGSMNTIVIKEGRLAELLYRLLKIAKLTYIDQYERPWCISFPCGNYGKPDMAVCELQGSPVKRTVFVPMEYHKLTTVTVASVRFNSVRRLQTYKHLELWKELNKEIKCLYEKEVCRCDGKETEGPYEVLEGADDPDCMFFYIVNNNVETVIGLPEEVVRFVYGTGYTPDKETARKLATAFCRGLNAAYRREQADGH